MGDTTDVVLPFVDVDLELKEDPSNVEWVWRFGVFGTCCNYTIRLIRNHLTSISIGTYTQVSGKRHVIISVSMSGLANCHWDTESWMFGGNVESNAYTVYIFYYINSHHNSMVILMESNLFSLKCGQDHVCWLFHRWASCLFLGVCRQYGLACVSLLVCFFS